MADPIYRRKAWSTAKEATLARDGHVCQVTPGCKRPAVTADHIIPWRDGGAWYDLDNLRATCKECNSGRALVWGRSEGWRRSSTHIILVVGPPLGGKSTYVRENALPGDVIVDYDDIATALGSDSRDRTQGWHEVINAARNAVLDKVSAGRVDADRVWIVSTNPNATQMFPHHEVVEVNPGEDVVRGRVVGSDRTAQAVKVQDDWFVSADGGANPSRDW